MEARDVVLRKALGDSVARLVVQVRRDLLRRESKGANARSVAVEAAGRGEDLALEVEIGVTFGREAKDVARLDETEAPERS